MALDLKQIRGKLNQLKTQTSNKSDFWKPEEGEQVVRIVPYAQNPSNPFVELYFHYNVGGKTYLSPQSFGDPDPIVEFAERLKRTGDSEDWRRARRMEPKLRTFVPVVVRGQENEGVRWWGFGKTVYQELLGYMADPEYGDITDPNSGTDITVELISAADAGTTYPQTKIRLKRRASVLSEDEGKATGWLNDQADIKDIYNVLSYDELKDVLERWINPEAESEEAEEEDDDVEVASTSTKSVASKKNLEKEFENLFD